MTFFAAQQSLTTPTMMRHTRTVRYCLGGLGLLLLLIIGLWLITLWYWNQILQRTVPRLFLPPPSELVQPTVTPPVISQELLVVRHIALPSPPATKSQTKVVSPIDISQINTTASLLKQSEPVVTQSHKVEPGYKRSTQTKAMDQAKNIYEQILTDNGLDLQIALPPNAGQREHLLNYLYRCAGGQFAVLQHQQLRYLSPKRYPAVSRWLRVVNGALSTQEQQWLKKQSGTPVRVFPQSMDMRLAAYIAKNLSATPLHALRARYQLNANGLVLTHISLNQQAIAGTWLLFNKSAQCLA